MVEDVEFFFASIMEGFVCLEVNSHSDQDPSNNYMDTRIFHHCFRILRVQPYETFLCPLIF